MVVRHSRRRRPSESFKVRTATPRDIDVLVRQRHMMFEDMRPRTSEEHRIADESYREWAADKMKRGVLHCFLATSRRSVAGGCGVWLREVQPSPGHAARLAPYLMSVYTEKEFRRKGVATLLVRKAERWARSHGYPEMSLHASRQGRKVYPKLGWERTWEMRVYLDPQARKEATRARARSSRLAG